MVATSVTKLLGGKQVTLLDGFPDDVVLARDIALRKNSEDDDDAFYFLNLDRVKERLDLWKKELPRYQPLYAVKCNPDTALVSVIASLGIGFDVASKDEIDIAVNSGGNVNDIIYANPCKTRSFIRHAAKRGINMMTFDNEEELIKVQKINPNAEMILRITMADPTANCPLNLKFGAEPTTVAPQLLEVAKKMGVNVVGISFHVGSGSNDPTAYRTGLQHARNLVDLGNNLGFDMQIVDIGGGFPGGEYHNSFEKIANVIREATEEFFPEDNIRLVAEPGRFFASAPFSLICNIIHATRVPASKITSEESDSNRNGYMYYINDGLFGSFNCIMFDHVNPVGKPLFEVDSDEVFPSTIWGPTCDSVDKIEGGKPMRKMEIGDWMFYPEMGAYTSAASSTFNGFARPSHYYVMSKELWSALYQ